MSRAPRLALPMPRWRNARVGLADLVRWVVGVADNDLLPGEHHGYRRLESLDVELVVVVEERGKFMEARLQAELSR